MISAYLNSQFPKFISACWNKGKHFHGNRTNEPRNFLFLSDFDKQPWGSPVHKNFPTPVSQHVVHLYMYKSGFINSGDFQ